MARYVLKTDPKAIKSTETRSILVTVPTQTTPSYEQTVIGQQSPYVEDVEEFRGIPYGTVDKRWTHSRVRSRLPHDIFDATKYGPKCPQPAAPNTTAAFQSHLDFPQDVEESEFECLNLIISRPSSKILRSLGNEVKNPLLPVYVYIHGGAFAFGAASDPIWDPARLISRSNKAGKPIIVVRMNYRLNIFGFLASNGLSISEGCNFGFFDQVTALYWISVNISAFGGDPRKITLGGQSAGGTAVYIHTLRALRMVDKVHLRSCIIQSPAAGLCGPFGIQSAEDNWNMLCRHLGFSNMNPFECLRQIRSLSCEKLLAVVEELGWGIFNLVEDQFLMSRPGDQSRHNISSFVQTSSNGESDKQLIQNTPLYVLSGTTDYEASIFIDKINQIQSFDELFSLVQIIPEHERVFQLYGIRSGISTGALHDSLYRLFTDVLFTAPAHQAFDRLEKRNIRRPMQLNNFVVATGNPFAGPFYQKANHCVDLIYLFDCFHDTLRQVDHLEACDGFDGKDPQTRTNSELVDDLQLRWIDFIHSYHQDSCPELSVGVCKTVIFDKYRKSETVDSLTNAEMRKKSSRIKAIEQIWESAQALVSAVTVAGKAVDKFEPQPT